MSDYILPTAAAIVRDADIPLNAVVEAVPHEHDTVSVTLPNGLMFVISSELTETGEPDGFTWSEYHAFPDGTATQLQTDGTPDTSYDSATAALEAWANRWKDA